MGPAAELQWPRAVAREWIRTWEAGACVIREQLVRMVLREQRCAVAISCKCLTV